jgi:uncharacterized protein (UPF0332 family)
MSIEKLVNEGSIHPFYATADEINKAMAIAQRDLALAESILDESLDWSYSIAYNAVLQACRAYMFYKGYRPAATESHKITIEFMKISVEEPLKSTVAYFDRVRKKRHRTLYNEVGLVTKKEATQLLSKTREYLNYISGKLPG